MALHSIFNDSEPQGLTPEQESYYEAVYLTPAARTHAA